MREKYIYKQIGRYLRIFFNAYIYIHTSNPDFVYFVV